MESEKKRMKDAGGAIGLRWPGLLQRWLQGCVVVIVIAHVVSTVVRKTLGDHWRPVTELFELDREFNVPTLFSAAMLLLCAVLAGLLARREKTVALKRSWWVLAVGLVYMTADETFSIHEKFSDPVKTFVDGTPFAGNPLLYHAWLLPYSVFAAIGALMMWRLLQSLPWEERRWFLLSGVVFLSGAMGIELISGIVLADSTHVGNVVYAGLVVLEETLEMVGVQILIHALLIQLIPGHNKMSDAGRGLNLNFDGGVGGRGA